MTSIGLLKRWMKKGLKTRQDNANAARYCQLRPNELRGPMQFRTTE